MEKKLATYTEPGIRLQLIKIYDEIEEIIQENQDVKPHKTGNKIDINIYYQIRKNRKRLHTFKWETPAKQKFNALIQQELLQTKMQL